MSKKTIVFLAVAMVAVLVIAGCGGAQKAEAPKFPTKAVQVIVPFAAGGGTDALARAIGKSAEPIFKQPITVVNKVGGNGATGMTEGLNANPDGYTVTMITVETVMNPIVGAVPWKPSDYKPVMLLNSDCAAVTVRADGPYKTFEDFIKAAKENPGKIRVGANAPGAIWHLAALGLQDKAGVQFNVVPFPGGAGPAILDLLGGHIDAVSVSAAEVSQHVKAGKLKILAVLDGQRMKGYPDVPTAKEKGVDVQVITWRGLAVPGKTPDAVVATLHDGFKQAMGDPKFKEFMEKGNFGVAYMDGKQFAQHMEDQTKMFKPLLEKAGLAKK